MPVPRLLRYCRRRAYTLSKFDGRAYELSGDTKIVVVPGKTQQEKLGMMITVESRGGDGTGTLRSAGSLTSFYPQSGETSGAFVGGGWTEANNVTLTNIASTVTRRDEHWVVTGAKYYATGSLYTDWLDVLGRNDDGDLRTALVRADDPGVELVDDWHEFGQRTTASGAARYDQVPADDANVFPVAERFGYQAHFYQIAMLSVLTGITRAALRDGTALLKARRRNYAQGLAEVPSADAQLLAVIGQVSADGFAADAALERAAERSTPSSPHASTGAPDWSSNSSSTPR